MNLRDTGTRRNQHGSVLVLLTLSLVMLLAMGGLAVGLGHAYVNKTRLQSLVDALALSAAITLDRISDPNVATTEALVTFDDFINERGNEELADLEQGQVQFEYSDLLLPFVAGGANPRFVRVIIDDFSFPTWLMRVVGINDMEVAATAVSGPIPLQTVCNVAPVMVCAEVNADGEVADPDCSDGACYGYDLYEETSLKTGASQGNEWEVGPGNYRLVRLDDSQGGDDIRHNMAGRYESCLEGDDIPTEPGNTVGPVAQGINTRLGIYQGGMGRYQDQYPPDLVSDLVATGDVGVGNPTYPEYENRYQQQQWDHIDGAAERRMLTVPYGDCSQTVNGEGNVPLVGFGCYFLTRPAKQNGQQEVYGEFVDSCPAQGRPDPNSVSGPGPYKIVLFKNPQGRDA